MLDLDANIFQNLVGSMNSSFPPRDTIYKLVLWVFLQKLNIIGLRSVTISHMASFTLLEPIPEGAYMMPMTGLNVEYIVPCNKKDNNWSLL